MDRRNFLQVSAGAAVLIGAIDINKGYSQQIGSNSCSSLGPRPSTALAKSALASTASFYRELKSGSRPSSSVAYALSITFVQDMIETGQASLDEKKILSDPSSFINYTPDESMKYRFNQYKTTYGLPEDLIDRATGNSASTNQNEREQVVKEIGSKGLGQYYLDYVMGAAQNVPNASLTKLNEQGKKSYLREIKFMDTWNCHAVAYAAIAAGATGQMVAATIFAVWHEACCS